jgi:hypothetical protein
MKSLYESILDDEDIIINNIKKDFNDLWYTAYSLLLSGSEESCAEALNKIGFKPISKGLWDKTLATIRGGREITFSLNHWTSRIVSIMVYNRRMYINFPKPAGKFKKSFENELYEYYKITPDEYKKFKKQLIKELDLEREISFSGDWWVSNKYK